MATTAILAGPGDFLPVIFVLIAIASGIINFVKERKAAAGRAEGNPRDWQARGDEDRQLQSEIDAFLQEVSPDNSGQTRSPRQGSSQQRQRRKAASEEEAERRRRVRARREQERHQLEAEQRRQSLRTRHLETTEVSSRHVESSVEDRHLSANFDNAPARSRRKSSLDDPIGKPAVSTQASSVVALLRQPEGIRNAVLLSEIIGPPLANRPRRKQ